MQFICTCDLFPGVAPSLPSFCYRFSIYGFGETIMINYKLKVVENNAD